MAARKLIGERRGPSQAAGASVRRQFHEKAIARPAIVRTAPAIGAADPPVRTGGVDCETFAARTMDGGEGAGGATGKGHALESVPLRRVLRSKQLDPAHIRFVRGNHEGVIRCHQFRSRPSGNRSLQDRGVRRPIDASRVDRKT
jgi:hypothetical protein